MKIPLSWLRDYVEFEADAKTLAERLTFAGIEVSSIELSETLGLPDYVMTLEITPNRPDLLGLLGIAREIAALFGAKLKWPACDLREEGAPIQDTVSVAVEDAADCPRYTARLLTDAKVGKSPFWLRRRLSLAGIKAINNIVDITNYVLLECGQPLHAFDLRELAGLKIIVRRAYLREKITVLDGVEYKLNPQILVIADELQPVAIAGIMGGAKSSIQPLTTSILLESACFNPALVRQTSKTLGLTSESSYRFERGTDINQVDFASRRACALMAQIAGAIPAKGVIDVFAGQPARRKITCRSNRVSSLLGLHIPAERMSAIFNSLDFNVVAEDKDRCTVSAPTFRPDLETEADLIEEIARMHGLDKIPCSEPRCHLIANADDTQIRAQFQCRKTLAALGLQEIVNYSFVSEKLLNMFDSACREQRIKILRPVSAEHAILRDSLLPQMAETLGRNRSRQIAEAAFFEISRVFTKTPSTPFHEETRVAVGLMGAVGRALLQKRQTFTEAEVFSWLKGILHNFCEKMRVEGCLTEFGNNDSAKAGALNGCSGRISEGFYGESFKPNRSALISVESGACGIMGILKDEIRREWRILEPVGLMEFRLAPFLKRASLTPSAGILPVYPAVIRDIALRVRVSMHQAEITKIIKKNSPKELTRIVLFDIYESKEIGAGFKSLAYSLTYQSPDRTLTDKEVNKLHETVKKRLKDELKVEIREG